jgi:hypothetical protein
MSRYEPLTRYLEGRRGSEAPLTFREVESILNRNLPLSARRHQPWWANTRTHSHAEAWLRVGWKTRNVDLASQRVVFVRAEPSAPKPAAPSSRTGPGPAETVVTLRLDALTPLAQALVLRYAKEREVSVAAAVSDLLHEAAIDRRRRLLDDIIANAPSIAGSGVDVVDLIREDRDAR